MRIQILNENVELSQYLKNYSEHQKSVFNIKIQIFDNPLKITSKEFIRLFSKQQLIEISNENYSSISFGIVQADNVVAWVLTAERFLDIVSNNPNSAWATMNDYFTSDRGNIETSGSPIKITNGWTDNIFLVQVFKNAILNYEAMQKGTYTPSPFSTPVDHPVVNNFTFRQMIPEYLDVSENN